MSFKSDIIDKFFGFLIFGELILFFGKETKILSLIENMPKFLDFLISWIDLFLFLSITSFIYIRYRQSFKTMGVVALLVLLVIGLFKLISPVWHS